MDGWENVSSRKNELVRFINNNTLISLRIYFVPKNLGYVSDKCGEQDLLGHFKEGESLPGEMKSKCAGCPLLVT
jgi:hypothetical protein